MEEVTVTVKVIILSVPATSSHLHLEKRLSLPGLGWRPLGWWPRQVYSGPCIPRLMAGVCSENKDRASYRAAQRVIQLVNTLKRLVWGDERPEAPPVPRRWARPTPPRLAALPGEEVTVSESQLPTLADILLQK